MVQFRSPALPPRAIAIGLTMLLHLAMLAMLFALGDGHITPRRDPPLSITLSLPQPMGEAERTPFVVPTADHAKPPPDAPNEPAPALFPPAPALPSEMPIAAPQLAVADLVASGPQFDAEPDPARTDDIASDMMAGAIASAAGTECPLVASLRAALEQDVSARAAVGRIPRRLRSVANAVMLWDGRWIAPERIGGRQTTDAIKAALATILSATTSACRNQVNLGPVFVPVSNDSETIILAFGSGAWRWADVLKELALDPAGYGGPNSHYRTKKPEAAN